MRADEQTQSQTQRTDRAVHVERWSSRCNQKVNPFTTGNPFLGTKLLGLSIARGSGALKGFNATPAGYESQSVE